MLETIKSYKDENDRLSGEKSDILNSLTLREKRDKDNEDRIRAFQREVDELQNGLQVIL